MPQTNLSLFAARGQPWPPASRKSAPVSRFVREAQERQQRQQEEKKR